MQKEVFHVACTLVLLAGCARPPTETIGLSVGSSSSSASSSINAPSAKPSIPWLIGHDFDGRDLKLLDIQSENSSYTRHTISYKSGELTISGIMNIPKGDGPFPLLILNHGYIDTAVYTNGRGLKREQDYLARQGYAVLHSDYRNHAFSDKDPNSEAHLRLGYAEDAINAILAVKHAQLPYVDTERVGMLGHSMGGGVTLHALIAAPKLIDAAVLFAPVSGDAVKNYHRWTMRRPELAAEIRARYGSPEENQAFWNDISASNFYDRIEDPVLIHHGTADDSVPLDWSVDTERDLAEAGVDVVLRTYTDEPHEFTRAWAGIMEETRAFFDQHVAEKENL